MSLHRRALLAATPALAAWPALAESAPAPLLAYERDTGGHFGLYAENLASGAKILWRADERFVMCSTFKASLAAFVLTRIDRGRDRLDATIRFGPADIKDGWYAPVAKANLAKGALSVAEMCAGAVEDSDNTCANLLLARVGGPAALTAFWRATGDRVTRLDHEEPVLNRTRLGQPYDTTTPAAMAGNLRRFVLGKVLSPASRGRLAGWMLNCRTGDNRLRAGLPKGWRIADKTGNNGKDAAGDIAVAWTPADHPVLICGYTRGGTAAGSRIDAAFAEIGRLVAQRLA